MEGWQCVFVLYSCLWSEISLMLDVFMEELGCVCLVVKGVCFKCFILKGVLQFFIFFLLCFGGCGEVKMLCSVEVVLLVLLLSGIMFYSGLYINEFFFRVLEYEMCFFEFFFDYLYCIQFFVGVIGMLEFVLCCFELVLFGYLGYGVNFIYCVGSGELVDDIMMYCYCEEKGFIVSVVIDNKMFIGRQLKVLNVWEFFDVDILCVVKCFICMVFKLYFGGKFLKSRELFWQFMFK